MSKHNNKKWLMVLSIALSLPSSIAGLALLINELVEKNILSFTAGFTLFLLVILGMLWLMMIYAFNKKN